MDPLKLQIKIPATEEDVIAYFSTKSRKKADLITIAIRELVEKYDIQPTCEGISSFVKAYPYLKGQALPQTAPRSSAKDASTPIDTGEVLKEKKNDEPKETKILQPQDQEKESSGSPSAKTDAAEAPELSDAQVADLLDMMSAFQM